MDVSRRSANQQLGAPMRPDSLWIGGQSPQPVQSPSVPGLGGGERRRERCRGCGQGSPRRGGEAGAAAEHRKPCCGGVAPHCRNAFRRDGFAPSASWNARGRNTVNATSTVAAALWLAIAVGAPHPSSATEGGPVGHGQRGALVAAIEHRPFASQARTSLQATYVGLRVAGTLDSPPALAGAAKRHTTQAARPQARGMRSLAQAERAPQAAAAGTVGAPALTGAA